MPRFTRTRPAPSVPKRRGKDHARYRPFVRLDFERCCAYCLCHEDWAGGQDASVLDHFRPKGLFEDLMDEFHNLYYSCTTCNLKNFKGSHWPSEQQAAQGVEFVDLCKDEFHQHYQLRPDGVLEGLTPSGHYTIDTVRLNREHLVKLRAWLIGENKPLNKPQH